jgi:hypothetical protein
MQRAKGQRWKFTSKMKDMSFILEIEPPFISTIMTSEKIIQVITPDVNRKYILNFSQNSWSIKDGEDIQTTYTGGTWEYLKGQDKII